MVSNAYHVQMGISLNKINANYVHQPFPDAQNVIRVAINVLNATLKSLNLTKQH
jgi:hypothetical protein